MATGHPRSCHAGPVGCMLCGVMATVRFDRERASARCAPSMVRARSALRALLLVAGFAVLLGLAACGVVGERNRELSGHVSIWHAWPESHQATLEEALTAFEESHPEVTVTTVAYDSRELLASFESAAATGVAPSLLLGSDAWVRVLADAGWIRPLETPEDGVRQLRGDAEEATSYLGTHYGVPVSLYPSALYYNTSLVRTPASTLEDLLEEAEDGRGVALEPRFKPSYWGIQAFGNGLFDAAGRFTVAGSGFAEWLEWLNTAQGEPGVILHEDNARLLDLFKEGGVAYYVAGPEMQAELIEAMGVDAVGVRPLPDGPAGSAGPLLSVETAYQYAFASPEQRRIAAALAQHLGSKQQSMRFMRELGMVPANPDVRVDSRLYPPVSGFAEQAETAVVLPSDVINEQLYAVGDRAYAATLSGSLSPTEAVCRFGLEFAELHGYAEEDVDLPYGCEADEPVGEGESP